MYERNHASTHTHLYFHGTETHAYYAISPCVSINHGHTDIAVDGMIQVCRQKSKFMYYLSVVLCYTLHVELSWYEALPVISNDFG